MIHNTEQYTYITYAERTHTSHLFTVSFALPVPCRESDSLERDCPKNLITAGGTQRLNTD